MRQVSRPFQVRSLPRPDRAYSYHVHGAASLAAASLTSPRRLPYSGSSSTVTRYGDSFVSCPICPPPVDAPTKVYTFSRSVFLLLLQLCDPMMSRNAPHGPDKFRWKANSERTHRCIFLPSLSPFRLTSSQLYSAQVLPAGGTMQWRMPLSLIIGGASGMVRGLFEDNEGAATCAGRAA